MGNCSKDEHGTLVIWKPSQEFFTSVEVERNKIKSLFKTISCLCPGLKIIFNDNGEVIEYFSKDGLNDLVNDIIKNNEILNKRFIYNFNEGKNKLDFILTYTTNYNSTIIPYVNTGLTEKGPHITNFKTLITREFNKFFREKKWIKEKEDNLSGDDIQEGLVIVFNITAPNVAYDAQVKSTITKIELNPFNKNFSENFYAWMLANEKEIKIIADKALNARKAREAARKARDAARNASTKKKDGLLNLPTKLVDAWGKDRSKCELYIAEGDAAAGGLISARDSEYQAVMPIRGKILSVRKASVDKILANQEIVNIIKALGLEFDPKTIKLIYDNKKLRYGKIMMAADADPDGQSIKNLLITLFWTLCPELIENGHLYSPIPPLFRITDKKNNYIYLKGQKELDEYKEKHMNEKFLINRNKGLGEQDPEELGECLLDPLTRNIEQITVDNSKEAENLLEILMGTSVPPRREYILKHSEEANNVN